MKDTVRVRLELCNRHLQELFRAIVSGNAGEIYQIEHKLTPEEECVACAYALRARGTVREVLDTFLKQEGFMVETPTPHTPFAEIKYWVVRLLIFTGLMVFISRSGLFLKTFFDGGRSLTLGSFGWVGVILTTIATFVILDSLLLED